MSKLILGTTTNQRAKPMKNSIFLPSIILSAVLMYLPSQGSSEKLLSEAQGLPAETEVVTLSDDSVTPTLLTLKKGQIVNFLVSPAAESAARVEIDFHEHTLTCNPVNFGLNQQGKISTEAAITHTSSASTCFKDAGTFVFTVTGLSGKPEGVNGTIKVE